MKSVKNNKKIKILILAMIVVGIIAESLILLLHKNEKKEMTDEELIRIAEGKFGKIESEELQEQILEKLKKSELNINTIKNSMEITTSFEKGTKFNEYICAIITEKNNGKTIATVEIPCFKINSDSNGKFKNIEYTHEFMGTRIIEQTIKEVLKANYNLYDIDAIIGSQRYHRRFQEEGTSGIIYYSEDEFCITIINLITDQKFEYSPINSQHIIDMFKDYETVRLGLDFSEDETVDWEMIKKNSQEKLEDYKKEYGTDYMESTI